MIKINFSEDIPQHFSTNNLSRKYHEMINNIEKEWITISRTKVGKSTNIHQTSDKFTAYSMNEWEGDTKIKSRGTAWINVTGFLNKCGDEIGDEQQKISIQNGESKISIHWNRA